MKVVIRLHDTGSDYHRSIDEIGTDIRAMGYRFAYDSEHNPITYWIYSDISVEDVRLVDGVFDAIESII